MHDNLHERQPSWTTTFTTTIMHDNLHSKKPSCSTTFIQRNLHARQPSCTTTFIQRNLHARQPSFKETFMHENLHADADSYVENLILASETTYDREYLKTAVPYIHTYRISKSRITTKSCLIVRCKAEEFNLVKYGKFDKPDHVKKLHVLLVSKVEQLHQNILYNRISLCYWYQLLYSYRVYNEAISLITFIIADLNK